jgi:uncharacterized alpha-E superfamily protein
MRTTETQDAPLLCRYAESLFWMARYLERAENLARILDVTQSFESPMNPGQAWDSVVAINADGERFRKLHGLDATDLPSPENVKRFYVLDPSNPTGIRFSIDAAKQNARTLRPVISTEMWQHINVFHAEMAALTGADIFGDRFSRLCAKIKENVQQSVGITEGTYYRDQGWYFLSLGRLVERADATTRLLDIKYHLLLPQVSDVGSALDLSQWHAVLRAAAGYHAYRRTHTARLTPKSVAQFLLFDASFPRSVLLCVRQAEWFTGQLQARFGLRGGHAAAERLEELRGGIEERTVDQVVDSGLHEFLDWVQRQLIAATAALADGFFHPALPGAAGGQGQAQA